MSTAVITNPTTITTNGNENGTTNGTTNGPTNGTTNGPTNGTTNGSSEDATPPPPPASTAPQLEGLKLTEQRRIFLESTMTPQPPPTTATTTSSSIAVKYATLPPPPKPPMLSRTRSTDTPTSPTSPTSPTTIATGNGSGTATDVVVMRHSFPPESLTLTSSSSSTSVVVVAAEAAAAATATTPQAAPISAKHYESLIEELRCPGCAGPMKAPVLLCRSGHSVCEQCTRILLMCPLCKESFTKSRSLTVEALCAKAHFRCGHASGGCVVRMPVALLSWHEQQCVYKPMKCFMNRVWGNCKWNGRELQWKEHLEQSHPDKLFYTHCADLSWDISERRKPLAGYYVFQAHGEMFNFYEIYDKQRILFTMTCTSSRRDSKYNYAYEVTLLQLDNDAIALTHKFPVHSEHDRDILQDGTCVSVTQQDLARFVDIDKKVLHYRVTVLAVKSPRRGKLSKENGISAAAAAGTGANINNYQQIAGVNGKSVPASMIITRTYREAMGQETPTSTTATSPTSTAGGGDGGNSDDDDDDEDADSERRRANCGVPECSWGTPQLHFNRKYLRNSPSDILNGIGGGGGQDEISPLQESRQFADDKISLYSNITSTTTNNNHHHHNNNHNSNNSYTRKVSDTLRKSFRSIKSDIIELRPFGKKPTSPEKTNNTTMKMKRSSVTD